MNTQKIFWIYWSLILAMFLSSSCGNSSPEQTTSSHQAVDTFQSYAIDINSPKVKLTNQIESIEILGLEETEASLLSDISEIFVYQDKLLFHHKKSGDIFIFNDKGKFINRINRSGKGPEEYIQITDMWLEGDTIAIHHRASRLVKKYDFQGNFMGALRLPNQINHMYSYQGGYVFGTNFIPMQDSIRYQWGTWKRDMSPKNRFLPYDASLDNQLNMFYSINTVHPYGPDRLLLRAHGDSVYLLRNNLLKPIIHFDFGEDWFWKKRGVADQADMIALETSKQAWENEINVGRQSIYLKTVIGYVSWEHFLIDRVNGEIVHLDLRKNGDNSFTPYPLLWTENRLLCAFPSHEINELVDAMDPERAYFLENTTLEQIENSENPVLVWIKFKKQSNDN